MSSSESWCGTGRDAVLCFFIGAVAGAAPFLFMQVLPSLLGDGETVIRYPPLVITALLIGSITAIVFCRQCTTKQPHEIFFQSLGFPALLIATVSNMTYQNTTDRVRAAATQQVLQGAPTPIPMRITPAEPLDAPGTDSGTRLDLMGLFVGDSWAAPTAPAPRGAGRAVHLAQQSRFALVVGRAGTREGAAAIAQRFSTTPLASDRFLQKNVTTFETVGAPKEFVVVYATYNTQREAETAYRILRINDPNVPVQIVSW